MKLQFLFVAIALSLGACGRPNEARAVSNAPESSASAVDHSSRFVIVQSTPSDPHTILLDTTTGQTWVLTSPQNGSTAWVQIYRPPAAENSN